MYLPSIFFPLAIIFWHCSLDVEACGKGEDTIKLHVTTRFLQRSYTSAYAYSKIVKSTKSFKKQLDDLKTSASIETSVSGSFKLFSASASLAAAVAYDKLVESVESSEKDTLTETSSKTDYNPNFLQIVRTTVTRVTINGRSAREEEKEFTTSRPQSKPLSYQELIKRAEDYMKYTFDDGAVKNTFTDTACIKRQKEKPKPTTERPIRECEATWMDTDLPGHDVGRLLNIPSKEACKELCIKNGACSFFTWVDGSYGGKRNYIHNCFLKSGHSAKVTTTGLVSGAADCPCDIVYMDTDYPGHDIGAVKNVATKERCRDICKRNARCVFWTWGDGTYKGDPRVNYKCHLKDAKGRQQKMHGLVSGPATC